MPKRTPSTSLGEELKRRVSRNVRRLRLEKGLTQASLGSASGVGRSFICLVERGKFGVTLDTLAALSEALGSPPSLLLADPAAAEQRRSRPRGGAVAVNAARSDQGARLRSTAR